MVFNLENTHTHKRIWILILISLLAISTLLQFYPVSAQTPEGTLTGTFTDEGVDTDDDGLFNYLDIGVEVNVTSAGTFGVEVLGFTDAEGNYLQISNSTDVELDVGIHVVNVHLDGEEIYDFGVPFDSIVAIYLDADGEQIDTLFQGLNLSREYSYSEFQIPVIVIDYRFDAINREITLNQGGSILIEDTYSITNLEDAVDVVGIGYPEDAYNIKVRDEMGNLDVSKTSGILSISLRQNVFTDQSLTLVATFNLPWGSYITQQNGMEYKLSSTFYEEFDYTVGELTVAVKLPEGAQFQSSTPNPQNTNTNSLKDTVTFTVSDVTPTDDLNFEINYSYLLFWSSLYPTVWVGVLVVIVSAFAILWKAPKPSTAMVIPVPPDDLRKFVNVYEEKTRIKSEVESMQSRLRKGKISRRRYKVRKKMLDGRLSTISRDLSSLHDSIRSAGPKYANMMRQLEVAEANLEGAERDIQRVENRYRRNEVSKGAYGKLMDEYKRRSEEAESTIDGIILRLKAEIR
jgi:hypothetical protein